MHHFKQDCRGSALRCDRIRLDSHHKGNTAVYQTAPQVRDLDNKLHRVGDLRVRLGFRVSSLRLQVTLQS